VGAWGVEKRRRRQNRRRELIQAVRQAAAPEGSFDRSAFFNSATYSAIRPHLRKEAVHALESIDILIDVGQSPRQTTHETILQDEMTRLERKWKLI
jgi:hypothetical protein